jgi:integrase
LGGKLKPIQVSHLIRKHTPGMYNDGGGLYLQVGANSASWIFRYKFDGRRAARDMGLGSAAIVSLAEARERALHYRRMLAEDPPRNPLDERRAARERRRLEAAKAMSFRECAEAYIAAHQAGWKNPKHAAQRPATLGSYVYPVMADLPVAAVDVGLVMRVLEPVWTTKPETASRVRGWVESVLDWATARGYRAGENPARWRGHLDKLLPKRSKVQRVEHHAALPYAEIAAFLAELRSHDGITPRALEFAILTAARTGAVIGATWSEIDLEGRLWTIPAERMKAGREHRVPLSEPAAAILRARRAVRESEFVFPGQRPGRPLSNMSLLMQLRRMGRGDLTTHGFRSTFSDWCAEKTSFPAEVREMALAHTVGDKVEAAYRRGDLFEKRRALAEAWARFCAGTEDDNVVVPLRRVAE